MDQPQSDKSYCAVVQLTQLGLRKEQQLVFGRVLIQMSVTPRPNETNPQTKRNALRSIKLIKEKRDGHLKGRTVADGCPQRVLYQKLDITSPTVSSYALLLSLLIDAHKGRYVATTKVVGAYLCAYMDEEVIMKYSEEFVDIILGMRPEYKEFVVYKKGVKILYVRVITQGHVRLR
jgi:hypothetical protein